MYHNNMIYKAKSLSRYIRKKQSRITRGVYCDENDELFDVYINRFPTGVVTLETALSYYGLTDNWINAPYDFCFQTGYRRINDSNIRQFRDNKEILYLGIDTKEHNGYTFLVYDIERLLVELFRKEKYVSLDVYKQAILAYRNLVIDNKLNIPLVKEYLSRVPKSNIYLKKLSREVL